MTPVQVQQINDFLAGLYRIRGMSPQQAQVKAQANLQAALARIAPIPKGSQSINGWSKAIANLTAWVATNP